MRGHDHRHQAHRPARRRDEPGREGWTFHSTNPGLTDTTGPGSAVNFRPVGTAPTTIREISQRPGYTFLSERTHCEATLPDETVRTWDIIGRPANGFTIATNPDAIISCNVYDEAPPGFEIEKSASPDTFTVAGQAITYTYTVTNNESVPLHDIEVHDDEFGLICRIAELPANESVRCTRMHTATEEDVERGFIRNVAFATGFEPDGTPITSERVTVTARGPVVPVTG